MQPIAIGLSDFEDIRTNGQIYVDKTAYLHRLITDPNCRYFFIARPRRFGKSLMISTFKAIFAGKKALFKGLAIAKAKYDWKKYPVIRLNFGFAAQPTAAGFRCSLQNEIERALREAGASYIEQKTPGDNFGNALDYFAAQGTQAVVLIDEYDDPVARTLDTPDEAEAIRKELASVYGQMKDRSEKIRFLMITGVSKFTKMSVFSALSNLTDISFKDEYAAMLGFTEDELTQYFGEYMHAQMQKMQLDDTAYRAELKRMYDGYRFGKHSEARVYNPVSVSMNLLECDQYFSCYWTSTGKSSFLMNFLKREEYLRLDITRDITVSPEALDVSNLRQLRPAAMLFQTGYLTIKDFDGSCYSLVMPNEEVRKDLSLLTAGAIADKDWDWAVDMGGYLLSADWKQFFTGLKSLYAGLTYGSTEKTVHESSFTRNLCFLLWGLGFRVNTEVAQAAGRADIVADHSRGTYIFELKIGKNAKYALTQAKARKYAEPYRAANKPVWLIGLSFNRKTRCLIDCAFKEVKN